MYGEPDVSGFHLHSAGGDGNGDRNGDDLLGGLRFDSGRTDRHGSLVGDVVGYRHAVWDHDLTGHAQRQPLGDDCLHRYLDL